MDPAAEHTNQLPTGRDCCDSQLELLGILRVPLDAIRAMSPRDTEIVVVDNGSSDGSIDFLRSRRDVRVMALPSNLGHGVALDLGVARVRTEYLAVLDVDAFPISDRWLPRVSKR